MDKATLLTSEDKSLLKEFKNEDAFKVIIKVLNLLAVEQTQSVLRIDLSQSDDRSLALAKARSEGAQKIVRDFYAITNKPPKPTKPE